MNRSWAAAIPGLSIGALLGAAVLGASAAWASHTDNLVPFAAPGALEPTSIRKTDNASVYYYFDSNGSNQLETNDRLIVNDMLDSEYRPTQLSFHYDSNPTFSGQGETDTIWIEGGVSGSAEGVTHCNDWISNFRCDQHYIRIEPGEYHKGLTCHEMGHAVGLTHGSDASPPVSDRNFGLRCLRTPVDTTDILGTHNRGQINGAY